MSAQEPSATARPRRVLDGIAVALFVAACAAPAVGAWLRPEAGAMSVRAEQRRPAPPPAIPTSLRAAARLPRELKLWHDDHLGLRDVILRTRSQLLWSGLGISPTPSAAMGTDGWLWYASESSMHAWRGAAPLWEYHVEDWARVFRDRAAWCKARGIAYVAALAPNKMEVYPERVPPPYEKLGPSRYDQITNALAQGSPPWFLDLRAELRDERTHDGENDFTYSQRGTHWTTRAALRGAVAMLTRARSAGVEVEIPKRSDFEFVPLPFDDDGWTGQLHMPYLPYEVQPVLSRNLARRWRPSANLDAEPKRVETATGVAELPRLWMVHDSFGAALRPMLAPFFSKVTYDWNLLGDFDPKAMAEFAPNLVIDLHTERQIFRRPPDFIASLDYAERAARFDRAGPSVWTLAASRDRARADDTLSCTPDGAGLLLEARRWGSYLLFPDADLSVPGTPILRLELEAEHEANLYVQWQLQDQPGWRAGPAVRRPLTGGPEVFTIEIRDATARGPLRISPEVAAGKVRLRAAEIRSATW
ncbi:MAG: hypothetical protein NTY35_04735 [Planctomycetota bacterium]|nr:hypothetical protein [Planctomycetota bacterium]